jgi:hypothetical protein
MRISLSLLLVAATLTAGCTGGTAAIEPLPAESTGSITEPWKSMNLPLDGGVVDLSNEVSLKVSYPTHTQATASGIVAVVSEGLTAAGFTAGDDKNVPSARKVAFTHTDGTTVSLTLDKRAERPTLKLTKR